MNSFGDLEIHADNWRQKAFKSCNDFAELSFSEKKNRPPSAFLGGRRPAKEQQVLSSSFMLHGTACNLQIVKIIAHEKSCHERVAGDCIPGCAEKFQHAHAPRAFASSWWGLFFRSRVCKQRQPIP